MTRMLLVLLFILAPCAPAWAQDWTEAEVRLARLIVSEDGLPDYDHPTDDAAYIGDIIYRHAGCRRAGVTREMCEENIVSYFQDHHTRHMNPDGHSRPWIIGLNAQATMPEFWREHGARGQRVEGRWDGADRYSGRSKWLYRLAQARAAIRRELLPPASATTWGSPTNCYMIKRMDAMVRSGNYVYVDAGTTSNRYLRATGRHNPIPEYNDSLC